MTARPDNATLHRLADVMDLLVDPRTGIVKQISSQAREASHPGFFHAAAVASNTGAFARQANFAYSGGASVDPARATAKAVGEAVERYCAALFDAADLPLTSAADAPFAVVPPAEFSVYTPAQYDNPDLEISPFVDDTLARWVKALDPLTGEWRHVPAAAVYIPYAYYVDDGEKQIMQPVSTGLACHATPADAAMSGLCEVIERDAFMVMWQARLAPPQIALDSLDPRTAEVAKRLTASGYRLTLFDITVDNGVPCVLALAKHDSPKAPAMAVAASAAASGVEAAQKAMEELPHTLRFLALLAQSDPARVSGLTPSTVSDQDDHVLYWAQRDRVADADFMFANPHAIQLGDVADLSDQTPHDAFLEMCRRVNETGHQVLTVDVTSPDIATLGLSVVRAVVPGYHPLTFGHNRRALGGRLKTLPPRLDWPGQAEAGQPPDHLSPHPYP